MLDKADVIVMSVFNAQYSCYSQKLCRSTPSAALTRAIRPVSDFGRRDVQVNE
jgi:hypothetical protein